eukprot:TRINITY_DN15867_c0_g2_i1.p1 TRINITY_DN15867_c0_g2~~TRINITY_DN15867_c0_g2_i1.p1  ORF type:complete len:195 (-),score=12.81 TRINITY_DN15867_c0_g2_i1:187-771(-)
MQAAFSTCPSYLMTSIWNSYNHFLQTRPLVTKSITVGLFNGAGDIFCQILTQPSYTEWKYDPVRTLKLVMYASVVAAPLCHYWYGFIDRTMPRGGVLANLQKVLVDQLFFAPFVILPIFSVSMSLLNGKGFGGSLQSLKTEWTSLVKLNWSLWPAVQFLNFTLVPVQHQVGFVSLGSFVWGVMVSWWTFVKNAP